MTNKELRNNLEYESNISDEHLKIHALINIATELERLNKNLDGMQVDIDGCQNYALKIFNSR